MIGFGAGDVFLIPPSTATDITPRKVGEVQEVTLDISQDKVELFGSSRFALMTAVTKAKISGTAKQAKIQGGLIASLLGGTRTTGTRAQGEDTSASGTTHTAATVTGFEDLGVRDNVTNASQKKVTGVPAAGEYAVTAAGVYTFGTSGVYKVNYSYSVAGSGETVLVTNTTMGLAPTFALGLYNTNPIGQKMGIKLYAATFDKFGLGFKAEEFSMPDLGFSCSADSSGNVLGLYLPDAE